MNLEQEHIPEPIPIVFLHKGDSWYLPYVLRQALSINQNSQVVLISDQKTNADIEGVKIFLINDLQNPMIDDFCKNYKHLSTNPKEYEVFCWLRWFYLLKYMEINNISHVFHLDSDVLIFSSTEHILSLYPELSRGCGFLIPQQQHFSYDWVASGHISYWTKDALQKFCNFIIDSFYKQELLNIYYQKWNWHLENKVNGGICDMTTLYLFNNQYISYVVNLLAENRDGTFDLGFGTSSNFLENEYEMQKIGSYNSHKRIEFSQNKPVIFKNQIPVKLHNIHFQGAAKRFIANYYSGLPFREKFKHILERAKFTIFLPLKIKIKNALALKKYEK
jgi:hypothetical protein